MRQATKIVDTSVSTEELRQLRIRLRDGFSNDGQISETVNLEQILSAYLNYLQFQLLRNQDQMDIGQVQEMLLEVASVVQAGQVKSRGQELAHFIDEVANIYRNGVSERGVDGFHQTVGDYAELLESVSREFPVYDYNGALQQLFLNMNQMFESQQKGWVEVLESILSMPESIGLVRHLKQECIPEITEWVEGGVQNLFQIHADLTAMVHKLDMRERLVQQQITRLHNSYQNRHMARNVIGLKHGKIAGALSLLRQKLVAIQCKGAEKRDLLGLVDSNIQEFQDLMAAARRAFFMRLLPESVAVESRNNSSQSAVAWLASRSSMAANLQIISS